MVLWNDSVLERRLALLLALMARCALDPDAFAKHSLAHVMKDQLETGDARERYLAGERQGGGRGGRGTRGSVTLQVRGRGEEHCLAHVMMGQLECGGREERGGGGSSYPP